MATLIPAGLFWYLFFNFRNRRNPILKSGLLIFLGAITATVFFGFVSVILGGNFLFIMNIIKPVMSFGFSSGYQFHPGYWFPFSYILQNTKGIVLPLIVVALGSTILASAIAHHLRRPAYDGIVGCLGAVVISFLMALSFHMIGHGQLSNDHIIAYLIPFVFLGVAGIFSYFLRTAGMTVPALSRRSWILKLSVFVIFVGGLAFGPAVKQFIDSSAYTIFNLLGIFEEYGKFIILPPIFLFFALLFISHSVNVFMFRDKTFLPHSIAFALLLSATNVQNTSIGEDSYGIGEECGYRRDQYSAVIDAYFDIREYDPNHSLRMWYLGDEFAQHPDKACNKLGKKINLTALYGAILGMRGFTVVPSGDPAYNLVETYLATKTFSQLSSDRIPQLPPRLNVAILSQNPTDHETALATLFSNGFKSKVLATRKIDRGAVRFIMTIADIRKDARARAEKRIN
jgi:hypothetical protein